MSGSLAFITANPAGAAFDRQVDVLDRQRRQQDDERDRMEKRQVDAAVRSGLQEITAVPSPTQTPAQQPQPQAPRPLMSPDDRTSFRSRLQSVEDPTGRAVNGQGFSGKYQFGTAALNAAGIYEPAPGEDLKTNQWKGTIRLPDGRTMTRDQFLADGGAQDTAFDIHQRNLDREISARGLDKFVGQNIGGRTITREDLYSAMHFAGPQGAERYLRSGGAANPSDANQTSVSSYLTKVGGPGGTVPTTTPGAPAGVDYSPILRRVAATPGGSGVGLQTLQQQAQQLDRNTTRSDRAAELQRQQSNWEATRSDTQKQRDLSRQDSYQKLAMEAFARGDVEAGKYYSKAGGIELPPEVMQNTGALKRLGDASTMAVRLYGTDRAGAARFMQKYLETGDAVQAIESAGVPARQGLSGGQVKWVEGPDGKSVGVIVSADGTTIPITNGAGDQVIRPQSATASGKVLAIQVKEKMLIAAGFPPREAAAMAAGAIPSGNSLASIAQKISSDVEGDFRLSDWTPEQKAAEKQRRLVEVRALIAMPTQPAPSGPASGLGSITAQPPAPAAPPAAAPRPPAGPPPGFVPGETPAPSQPGRVVRPPNVPPGSQFSPTRNLWRDPSGRMYDQNGNPV